MSAPVLGPSESRVEPPAAATARRRVAARRHCRSRQRHGAGSDTAGAASVSQERNLAGAAGVLRRGAEEGCTQCPPMTMTMLSIFASGGVVILD